MPGIPDYAEVLYEISAESAEFDLKVLGAFCKLLHKAL